MIKNAASLLETTMAAKDKAAIVSQAIERTPELAAILTLAAYHNATPSAILKYRSKFDIVDSPKGWEEDYKKAYNFIVYGTGSDRMLISSKAFDVAVMLISPAACGLSLIGINNILANQYISYEDSAKLLDVAWQTKEDKLKVCGVCGRGMASTGKDGVCHTCKEELKAFITFRRGEFVVPINPFNFKKFKRHVESPVSSAFLDYNINKVGETIEFTHRELPEGLARAQFALPIEEFAVKITVL